MASIAISQTRSSLLKRCAPLQTNLSTIRCISSTCSRQNADTASSSRYTSPFRGPDEPKPTTSIPSFAKYRNKGGELPLKLFQYVMVGSMGAISALGAKATVQGPSPFLPHFILESVFIINMEIANVNLS